VPWSALLAVIAPHYPKLGNLGRQPYPMETMLRVHLMQQWYALSDPAMEGALCVKQFPLLLALVEYLEEQQPDQLADTLRVTFHAHVRAHYVLDGFEGAVDGHAGLICLMR